MNKRKNGLGDGFIGSHLRIKWDFQKKEWEEESSWAKFDLNYESAMEKMNKRAMSYINIFPSWMGNKQSLSTLARVCSSNIPKCYTLQAKGEACFAIYIELVDESIWEARKQELLLVVHIYEMRKTVETVPWFRSEKRKSEV